MKYFNIATFTLVLFGLSLSSSQLMAEPSKPSMKGTSEQEVKQIKSFFNDYMAKYNHYISQNEFKDKPYLYHTQSW